LSHDIGGLIKELNAWKALAKNGQQLFHVLQTRSVTGLERNHDVGIKRTDCSRTAVGKVNATIGQTDDV
jgi:hypothetical protein